MICPDGYVQMDMSRWICPDCIMQFGCMIAAVVAKVHCFIVASSLQCCCSFVANVVDSVLQFCCILVAFLLQIATKLQLKLQRIPYFKLRNPYFFPYFLTKK